MKKTIYFILMLILFIIPSCDKNTQHTAEADNEETINTLEESRGVKAEETLINEDRWIDAPDGMRMREQPDSSSNTVTVIPSFSKVLLIEETGEEMTLQDHTGRWSFIEWDGQRGYVFGGYLSKEKIAPPLSQTGFYYGKYDFIDDPYNEQYIIFRDDNTCTINKNMCEGFYDKDYFYRIDDDTIKIYEALGEDKEDFLFKLIIISERELQLLKGASYITCGNLHVFA